MGIRSNNRAQSFFDIFTGTGSRAVNPAGGGAGGEYAGHTATGGFISDWTDPGGQNYRTHIFTTSGTFNVTELNGNFPSSVDFLVVGGGGGGGHRGGGGGAGGLRSSVDETGGGGSLESSVPIAVASYSITVGQGGMAPLGMQRAGLQGGDSVLNYNGGSVTAAGGGGGGSDQAGTPLGITNQQRGQPGGSGGGGANGQSAASGTSNQGYAGRDASGDANGGGGGAGGEAPNANSGGSSGPAGPGGIGVQVLIAGNPTTTGIGDRDALNGQWFGGGGGGGHGGGSGGRAAGSGGRGGGSGGSDPWNSTAENAMSATGGGGGGGGGYPQYPGGWGGPGIVAIRYQTGPGSVQTAKATGGAVSYYNGKTIHTFLTPGIFETTANWASNTDVEYVVVGGGGAGGETRYRGGGGGAGCYKTGSFTINAHPSPHSVTIGQGGKNIGQGSQGPDVSGQPSSAGNGGTTSLGVINAPGGGMGGAYPNYGGVSGGSGGGAGGSAVPGGPATGDSFPGTIGATPPNGWGHGGGPGTDTPIGSGGGGAGSSGNPNNPITDPNRGMGGNGVQVPTTFRNPATLFGTPGPNGGFYLAGGGNAGGYSTAANPRVATVRPAGGGGFGGNQSSPYYVGGEAALANTGGGGGGASSTDHCFAGGMGGSGIVLIAYPT